MCACVCACSGKTYRYAQALLFLLFNGLEVLLTRLAGENILLFFSKLSSLACDLKEWFELVSKRKIQSPTHVMQLTSTLILPFGSLFPFAASLFPFSRSSHISFAIKFYRFLFHSLRSCVASKRVSTDRIAVTW